jgi:hypothetical protein
MATASSGGAFKGGEERVKPRHGATVRDYLRCAYKKLGMHDKSQIPWLRGLRENAATNPSAPNQGD